MTKVFPAWRIETSERRYDPDDNQMTAWKGSGGYFAVESDVEDYIDEAVGHGVASAFFLMNLTKDPDRWAAVFFTDIIPNSDDVLKARAELSDKISFAAYGAAEPGMGNPPLGAAVFNSRTVLETASSRHEVFKKVWDALQSCDPNKNWVAVVDL